MKSIGFTFSKNEVWFVILEGDLQAPVWVKKDRFIHPDGQDVGTTLQALNSVLNTLLVSEEPDQIVVRFTLSASTANEVQRTYYSQGVLFRLAATLNIPCVPINPAKFTPARFNFPKGTICMGKVDQAFGDQPPYWNKTTKETALAAWLGLGGDIS
jgi:hypothetical protein